MKIKPLVAHKTAYTISPDESVKNLVDQMNRHAVGALVVSSDRKTVEGVVSERDVVRSMHGSFDRLGNLKVRDIMSKDVHTITDDATVDEVMEFMTNERIRHLPVVDENLNLVSIVSIGDILKNRLDEIAAENQPLINYVPYGF